LLFTLNMMTTNFALLFLSYPTQVIGRNSRYLFVVLVGAFYSRVPHKADIKLPKHKLFVAIFITFGVLLFNFMKEAGGDAADHHDPNQVWKGYILLIVSIISDALFSDSQAYSKVSQN
jgi:drug/metabolite transporter (DMT)-like permease